MYFFPLNTIPVLVFPNCFKKMRGINKTDVFFYKQFYDFSIVFCIFRLSLAWYHNSKLRFRFLVQFYIDYSGAHIFFIFYHICIIEETQVAKIPKNPCFEQFEKKLTFAFTVSSIIEKQKNKCGHQIRAQNRATMQRKVGKWRKLSKNHKIACRKKQCEKIPSAPITI